MGFLGILGIVDIVSISYRNCIDIVSIHIARPFVCHFQTHATVALLGLFCFSFTSFLLPPPRNPLQLFSLSEISSSSSSSSSPLSFPHLNSLPPLFLCPSLTLIHFYQIHLFLFLFNSHLLCSPILSHECSSTCSVFVSLSWYSWILLLSFSLILYYIVLY